MTPKALYVELDPYAAAWIRNLIQRDVICPGDVYCGDVRDCRPSDLSKYNQVHLYAGIAVWSYGLRRAGIPDSANVWTFSEPCQPFSAAGKRLGFADERYLRPYTHHLVEQCRPAICLGEQVASNDGLAWLDVVQSDMENAGYALGPSDTCSAGFGAPHIRQRLRFCAVAQEWLADATITGRIGRRTSETSDGRGSARLELERLRDARVVADSHDARLEGRERVPERADQCVVGALGVAFRLADADGSGTREQSGNDAETFGGSSSARSHDSAALFERSGGIDHNSRPGPTNGFWSDADWLYCRDGKWRPVEPGTFPLAHGAASRVGRLRAYGNAVDGEATTEYCRAVAHVLGI